jgi:hypothetical protein
MHSANYCKGDTIINTILPAYIRCEYKDSPQNTHNLIPPMHHQLKLKHCNEVFNLSLHKNDINCQTFLQVSKEKIYRNGSYFYGIA